MRQKPRGRWLSFTAEQEYEIERVGFEWRARFRAVPLVWMAVTDRYSEGEGLLEARLWNRIPVTRSTGADVAEGQALRYLAELPWVPHAMRANTELEWVGAGPDRVRVATSAAPRGVTLAFDAAGDVTEASASERPRDGVPTPWGGTFADYEEMGGVRIPTRAEVRWELPDEPFAYWRGRVTSFAASR